MKYLVSSSTRFIMSLYSGGGKCGGHEISYMFGGWEVWVHGDDAILYYVYANVVILCRQVHTLHSRNQGTFSRSKATGA